MVTRSARSDIISNLLLQTGLQSINESAKELTPYRIKKDSTDLNNLVTSISSVMNTFSQDDADVDKTVFYCHWKEST